MLPKLQKTNHLAVDPHGGSTTSLALGGAVPVELPLGESSGQNQELRAVRETRAVACETGLNGQHIHDAPATLECLPGAVD